jgi:hypothetical protein
MMDISALLQCTNPTLSKTNLGRVSRIVIALLAIAGRMSMLGRREKAVDGIRIYYEEKLLSSGAVVWLVE